MANQQLRADNKRLRIRSETEYKTVRGGNNLACQVFFYYYYFLSLLAFFLGSVLEVLLPALLGIHGIKNGLPLSRVTLPQLLDLSLHHGVQSTEAHLQLLKVEVFQLHKIHKCTQWACRKTSNIIANQNGKRLLVKSMSNHRVLCQYFTNSENSECKFKLYTKQVL